MSAGLDTRAHKSGCAVLSLVFLVALAVDADAGRRSRLLEFAAIGFSTELVSRYIDNRDTCLNATERLAGAAAAGVLGATSGFVFGALVTAGADGDAGDVILGGVAGSMLGRIAGQALGNTMTSVNADGFADLAQVSLRDFKTAFEFRVCNILNAADAIRAPLLERYVQIAPTECVERGAPSNGFTRAQWNEFIECNNNREGLAREVTHSLIELNLATCRSIRELYTIATTQARSVPNLHSFVGSADPGCVETQVRDAWGGFIADRQ